MTQPDAPSQLGMGLTDWSFGPMYGVGEHELYGHLPAAGRRFDFFEYEL